MNSFGAGAVIGGMGLACGGTFSLASYFGMQALGYETVATVSKTIGITASLLSTTGFYFFTGALEKRIYDAPDDTCATYDFTENIQNPRSYALGCALAQFAGIGVGLAL